MNQVLFTDQAMLNEIGQRLARRRVASGLTQNELARQAGVGRSTVERLEAGRSTQMSSFIRILRVLGLLEPFLNLVPETGSSPMDLLKRKRQERQRAFSRRGSVQEPPPEWTWGDDS